MGWSSGRNNKSAVRKSDVRAVVAEAERLLGGRTIEQYIARRQKVPAWTLIALLGHGTRLDLMKLAHPAASPNPAGWSGTVARLAGQLLMLSWVDESLTRLQRQALIPMELELLGGHRTPPSSPTELHEMVTESLESPLSF